MSDPLPPEPASGDPALSVTEDEGATEPGARQQFALWAVFRRNPAANGRHCDEELTEDAAELAAAVAAVEARGVTLRGWYDVSGLRADADVMVWLHAEEAPPLQAALRRLRRTAAIGRLLPTWSALAVHRDAEFNRSHVPGFMRGEPAREWLTLYPFVRSTEWYLLPDEERRRMLAEHGRKGAAHTSVVANTMSAFALGDYEWMLPMESDVLTDLVDLMRDLRATDARRHMRDELPFFTGRRIPTAEVPSVLV